MLSIALLVPWASGILLVALDGRRPAVAWLAVAALAANLTTRTRPRRRTPGRCGLASRDP